MRVLIIGSLSGELGKAARIVLSRRASVDHADSLDDAVVRIRNRGDFRLVICDIAFDIKLLIDSLWAERITLPVIACGVDDPKAAAQAIADGAEDFLPLPPDPDLIAAFIESVSEDRSVVICRDPAMRNVLHKASQIATSDASVLITGESGTGKEVIARHIHSTSRRSDGPFVALNCAALPESLVESELFGHEKGAFSGAVARRVGRFEAADGGTLLLDEISEMDVRLQAKLLRAIQEREIDRLGGVSPVRVNVRIIATSNRNLISEVSAGRFREDLYFRLNVVSLNIPPLRERPLDVVHLSHHFLEQYSKINDLAGYVFSDNALKLLAAHPWRGNVRELENAVHRALLMSERKEIGPESFELTAGARPAGEILHGKQVSSASWVGKSIEEVEQAFILDTLDHTDGNRTHAASLLGISIRALRNKLRDYTERGIAVRPPSAGVTGAA